MEQAQRHATAFLSPANADILGLLQHFWWEQGDSWQEQWEKLYNYYSDNELALFFLCTIVIPALSFWMYNAVLIVIHLTGKPHFFTEYKIQKNHPADLAKLGRALITVVCNQIFISIPMIMLMYPIMKYFGNPCSIKLHTYYLVLLDLIICVLIEETFFYYSHWLLHHHKIYKYIHKKHHDWTAPIGIVGFYSHPLDHILSNMLPAIIGPMLMGSHVTSIMLWFSIVVIGTTITHSGYHLPFLPSPQFHDFHHLKSNQCYGIVGILDRLNGTDLLFRQNKAYDRHILLFGLTPLNKSLPPPPQKKKSTDTQTPYVWENYHRFINK
ncbi:fatty acid hydroxylase domain-containing protein 2-like [Pelobates fuscus]|uniref:fatty acid hydroxylase domain-containing protein 2-like n=1 Tax=Pelobates fuscus TaxID=191477 RepID=UPI002FE4A9B2